MVRNGIFWTIEEQSYFVYYPIISYIRINVYRFEKNGYGKIPLEQWCQWHIYHIHRVKYYGNNCTR